MDTEPVKTPGKYTIDGKIFTLAAVSPKRLASYCELLGISDFSAMSDPEGKKSIKVRILNIGLDVELVAQVLDTCLIEKYEGDLMEIDLSLVDEVLSDFFLRRLQS